MLLSDKKLIELKKDHNTALTIEHYITLPLLLETMTYASNLIETKKYNRLVLIIKFTALISVYDWMLSKFAISFTQ